MSTITLTIATQDQRFVEFCNAVIDFKSFLCRMQLQVQVATRQVA